MKSNAQSGNWTSDDNGYAPTNSSVYKRKQWMVCDSEEARQSPIKHQSTFRVSHNDPKVEQNYKFENNIYDKKQLQEHTPKNILVQNIAVQNQVKNNNPLNKTCAQVLTEITEFDDDVQKLNYLSGVKVTDLQVNYRMILKVFKTNAGKNKFLLFVDSV
ncbi:Hypothetical_protein [Hexamita inflata]|uniref:Hypothetical_protein n=1 Tax=Hexamita inflata TaxID=28002 RepID=A0AA86QTT2_9EUKA|nr:Hypothetical protein HINF_LOCUS48277 [Hexamita inflata]